MNCITCGKELTSKQKRFCSKKCNNKYHREKNPNKVYKRQWYRENYQRILTIKENYAKEKGFASLNKLTYRHQYIKNIKPKPKFCLICNEKKELQLASINHTYTKNPDDYIYLCQSCHILFDKLMEVEVIER